MASNDATHPSWWASVVFSDDPETITETVGALCKKLKEVTRLWWEFGLQLKQHPAPLDEFRANPERDTVAQKFQNMLLEWTTSGKKKYRTWGALTKAVEECGNRALSKRIKKEKFYNEGSQVDMGVEKLTELLQQVAPQWKKLSINLGIPIWISDGIDNKLTADQCLTKVVNNWITNPSEEEEPTFEVLLKALESYAISNRALAIRISQDVEVWELLTVSEKERDQEAVKDKLKTCIAKLRKESEDLDSELQALDTPPTETPGFVSSTSDKEKELVENK